MSSAIYDLNLHIASQNLQNSKITDPTKLVHVQGDAAFADYSISVGYSYTIGKRVKALKVPAFKNAN